MSKKSALNPKTFIESRQITSLSKRLNTLAVILIIIIGLRYIAQDLIAPILLTLFFTVLTYPIFKWFRNKGFGRNISLILMILTFLVSVFLIITFFNWSFGLVNESLGKYVSAFKESFTQTAQYLNLSSSAETVTRDLSPETISAVFSTFLNSLSGFIYYFIFIPILSIMILLQIDSLPENISQKLLQENPGLKRLKKFTESITLYIIGRFKVNLITGLLFTTSLIIIGIDYPFVWGLLTVILSFIPYIGLLIAGIPPVILAFATGQAVLALLVIVVLGLINLFTENIIEPYIQGQSNKISMATVVISLIFWSWLLGFVGIIMAIPLTILLKTILSDYQETRWIATLMEGNYVVTDNTSGRSNLINRFLSKILSRSNKT